MRHWATGFQYYFDLLIFCHRAEGVETATVASGFAPSAQSSPSLHSIPKAKLTETLFSSISNQLQCIPFISTQNLSATSQRGDRIWLCRAEYKEFKGSVCRAGGLQARCSLWAGWRGRFSGRQSGIAYLWIWYLLNSYCSLMLSCCPLQTGPKVIVYIKKAALSLAGISSLSEGVY